VDAEKIEYEGRHGQEGPKKLFIADETIPAAQRVHYSRPLLGRYWNEAKPFGAVADDHHNGVSAHPTQFSQRSVQASKDLVGFPQTGD
jgi:hypothetical protein